MLAPEPYFQSRGTPISVYFRLKALSSMGHEVDLVTYHRGEDRTFPKIDILRIPDLFGIRKIKIGPSWAKIPLDFLILLKSVEQLLKKRYDVIFSHEEAALIGVCLSKIWSIPHIYDMHSSLPQQLVNFNFSTSPMIRNLFNRMERFILKSSSSVIVICTDLFNQIKEMGFGHKGVLLENFLEFETSPLTEKEVMRPCSDFQSRPSKIVLYTGNFQTYQGVELLLEAVPRVNDRHVKFVMVGGTPEAVNRMKSRASQLKVLPRICFTGQVDPSQIPHFIQRADVLVSPRVSGTNTPLKIYSYLKSGKPLVATDLWTHTQVLDESICVLVKPKPEEMAKGIQYALFNEEAKKRAGAAKDMAQQAYTFPQYKQKMGQVIKNAFRSQPPRQVKRA
ncbi:MAG: glycosyltransferase [Candidatus Aminicenantes bacterium]|nr:glycosyltransferase [Candidatus Aminicenantes bacterium]